MSSTTELKSELESLWNEFTAADAQYRENGVKKYAVESRNALGKLKKLITPYKKASVQECKDSGKKESGKKRSVSGSAK